jgi:DNA-binding transcriptional ArsR family regulator
MPHPSEHASAREPLGAEESVRLAEAMTAFTAPSRLRILFALTGGERTVDELAEACELTATACSQQLRVLRQLHAVSVRREGRHAHYRLYDHHLADLLAAVRHHGEHRALPAADGSPAPTRAAAR